MPRERRPEDYDATELRRLYDKLAAAEKANNHSSAAAIRAEIDKRRGPRPPTTEPE